MSSKRSKRRSIASQLVALFTLATALLLFCGLGVFYWVVAQHAESEDNAVLSDKLTALRADLKKASGWSLLENELRSVRAGEHTVYWVRVIDSNGHTVAETPGMEQMLPIAVFPAASVTDNAMRATKEYRVGSRLFSVVAAMERGSGQDYTLQLAQDRSSDEQFTREFGALVVIVLACGILAAAFIAFTVTKRGLRPLSELTHSLERVGPQHLNERVAPAGWPRELQPFASAFDEMLDRLEDSFTRLSQFSADLAHELRTPVANIFGEAQVALSRARSSDEYREVLESTATECEKLSGIVDNLLFVARADAARDKIHRTTFDGRAAVEKIAAYYQTIAEDRNISIQCTGNSEVHADSTLFARALGNLLDNALHHTPDGGKIEIAVTQRAGAAEVAVRDTGCGISAEHLPRVFDRFYRADSSRSSGGAGLGLALVKSITDLHGGTAAIQSKVDQGTAVVLTFPNKA
jgi:two-component system, OmpR family, heavy metal sensor histidine kinase CusS